MEEWRLAAAAAAVRCLFLGTPAPGNICRRREREKSEGKWIELKGKRKWEVKRFFNFFVVWVEMDRRVENGEERTRRRGVLTVSLYFSFFFLLSFSS